MTVPNAVPTPDAAWNEPVKPLAPWLRAALRCPVTGEELLDVVGPDGTPVLLSRGAGLAYPVRDGVPVLLAHEAMALRDPGAA